MSFITFAWIASIVLGFSTTVGKLTMRHRIANPWLYGFIWVAAELVFTIPIALWYGAGFPTHWNNILLLGFFSALTETLFIQAFYRLDVSVLMPLYSFRTAMSVLLGVFLFGEHLNPEQIFLIILIVLGGLFVSMDERFSMRSFFKPAIALAFAAITTSAIWGATVKHALAYDAYWDVMLWGTALTAGFVFLWSWPYMLKDLRIVHVSRYQGVVLSAFLLTIGVLAQNKAFETNLGLTSAIVSLPLSMIFAFAFSVFAPKLLEKHTFKVYAIRFAAAVVMVGAAIRLSL